MKNSILAKFFASIITFFKSIFCKAEKPADKQLLSKQYIALDKENKIIFEILEIMKEDWRDPYTFERVCELVNKLPKDSSRYRGAEQLHWNANGVFCYYDDKNKFHEVSYEKMLEEYYHFQKNGGVPKDLLSIQYFPAIHEYIPAMQRTWGKLELIKAHVAIRKEKNDEKMERILLAYYNHTAANVA